MSLLEEARIEINEIDAEMARLFARRMAFRKSLTFLGAVVILRPRKSLNLHFVRLLSLVMVLF